jgi:hypothetical protein
MITLKLGAVDLTFRTLEISKKNKQRLKITQASPVIIGLFRIYDMLT